MKSPASPALICPATTATYLACPTGAERPWLMDLRGDPAERRNVAAKHPAICRRLHNAVAKFDPQPFQEGINPWQ